MPSVHDLVTALDSIAPFALAEEWDNVGLLIGRSEAPIDRVLLTIDLTAEVLDEAIGAGAQAIVAYHPPIFRPIKRLSGALPAERIILSLAERGIAVVTPHTALDAAPNGLNDWIAEGLGAGDVRALTPFTSLPRDEETKIVTFCPEGEVDRLRDSLAAVGAGRIGGYERCSFELRGTGTFFGGATTRPAHGEEGRLERIDEVRLEMVCSRAALALAVESIRHFHPYEEPPIEIYTLAPRPARRAGSGRRIVLDEAVDTTTLAARVRARLGVEGLEIALPDGAPRLHQRIGLSAGSGGSHIDAAIASGCTLFFTGECRHHDVLAAVGRGMGVLLAGHTNTERAFLGELASRLRGLIADVTIEVSRSDRDLFARL